MSGPNNVGINIFAGEPPDPIAGTGQVFWVGATATVPGGVAGSDNAGNFGSSPKRPFATLDYALGFCSNSRGDVIYLLPQHQEDVANATTFQLDKIGVSVIGLGRGTDRPQFNFTATGGSVELDAANCRISNVMFIADITAVVVGVNVDAAYCEIDNCEFNFNASGDDFLKFVDVDAVGNTWIHDCLFYAENATAGSNDGIRLDTAPRTRIERCQFYGDFARSPIISEGAASVSILIKDNVLYNDDTGNVDNGIALTVADTGLLINNRIATLHAGSALLSLDPGYLLCLENYSVNAIDQHGVVVPATSSK